MAKNEIKMCLWCEHFCLDEGWGGTDVTPGDPARLECLKGKWDLSDNMTQYGLISVNKMAETCPHYELSEGCKK